MQDGKKLIQEYTIDSYEANIHGEIKLQNLLLYLQDMADKHTHTANLGADFCKEHNIAWILVSSHLVIERMPKAGETITISSWPFSIRRIGVKREYLVKAGDEVLVRASSLWICLDMIKKRPVSMLDYVSEEFAHEETVLETKFAKIIKAENAQKSMTFPVLFNDLDINNHVNNVIYPIWAMEGLGADWQRNYAIKELEIQYKEETIIGENVTVFNEFDGTNAMQYIEKENGNITLLMASKWEKR